MVISSALVTLCASDIYLPSMPKIAAYFLVDNSQVQLSLSFYLGGQIITTLLWGTLSDTIGRKKTYFIGTLVFIIGTFFCIFSETINIFLLGRLLQGAGGIVSAVVGWALIQDVYPKDKSAGIMSWMGSIISIAPMIAPVLGGLIATHFGWKYDFYLIAFFASIVLVGIYNLPDVKITTVTPFSPISAAKQYLEIITNKLFISYVCLFALLGCGEWCFLTIAPFLYKNTLHLSEDKIGFLMALSASFYIFGGMCSPALLTRLGINAFLGVASCFSILGGLLLLGIHYMELYNSLLITAAFGFYVFFTALVWGASTSKALQCFDQQRGSASAIRSLLIIGFFTLGSYIALIPHLIS